MSPAIARQRRRRRRRDASPVQRTPEQRSELSRRRRIGGMEALASVAIVVICLALSVLIWINAASAIRERAEDQRGRVEAALTAQATTLAMQVEHELLMIDQSLAILQAAWDQNPDTTRLDEWQKKMPALAAVTKDLFIANQQHVIVQDILPAAIGQGIGAAYGNFANGSLEPLRVNDPAVHDTTLLIGELGNEAVTRQFVMYLVRPLLQPAGWLIGASYHSQALSDVFAVAGLGQGGLAALIDTRRGGVQALAGRAAVNPTLLIAKSPLYPAMTAKADSGVWIGPVPIDGVDRIVAFHRVPGRELVALVAETSKVAMGPADSLAVATRSLAMIATLLVAGIGAAVLWEIWHWRQTSRRRRLLAHAQSLLASLQAEHGTLRQRIAIDDLQVQTLLPLAAAGVATVDAQDRLTRWNTQFAESLGLPPDMLHAGVPLDALLRRQLSAREAEPAAELEAEIVRRLATLRTETGDASIDWTVAGGSAWTMRARPLPDGGLLLVAQRRAEALPAPEPEQAAADPVEL